ncbi:MAG: efflux RND transporter periplasmic adaptor subunit [Planctomycetes bacterium]|nr:efflux RND transporter periplasmic adaptor subunit [Planctomycetota bacterium]
MTRRTVALKYVLPLIALGMLIFSVAHALSVQRPEPRTPPPVSPPQSPFGDTVAGAGMVEPSTEASGTGNIAVGSQLAGTVTRVAVRVGQEVRAGDPLFELDARLTEAELKVREATVAVTEAQVRVAEANLKAALDTYERAKQTRAGGASSEQDYVTAEQAHESGRAQLAQARANVQQARAQVAQSLTQLQILKIRAPVDGTVIQVNVRPGEYVATVAGQSLVLMGNLRPLHVRVNVDEEDLPRLKLAAPARAKIRGDLAQTEVPLTFVRLEPFIVPKTSLTGVNTERVDTRVVQVIFAVDPENPLVQQKKVLVGQLVDVFIDARPSN